jgi:acetamidase/formamidase
MKHIFATSSAGVVLAAALLGAPFASAAEHTLLASPQTVNFGNFNAANKPALTIASGDIVTLEAATQIDPVDIDASGVVPPSAVPQFVRDIFREVKDRGPGPHVLTGPIYVTGAEPGDVLEVRILQVDVSADYGYNTQRPYSGLLPEDFTNVWQRVIPIDRKTKTARVAPGVVVPVDRPFFGTMGVAPPAKLGRISSGPPGIHAGNLDNKDLGAGATLYIPVHVAGALFSAGDGHAAQGHGEIDVSAIEANLRGKFQFIVRKDMHLVWTRAETPTHWIVMGLAANLDDALKLAARETIKFITERFPTLSREEAYAISSIAVDYHVTQAVDRTVGIHGMIPKVIFTGR